MQKSAIAAFLALGLSAPAHAYDLNWSVGMQPSAAIKNPQMKPLLDQVAKLIGPANYTLAARWIAEGVASPINGINDFYYINACEPHSCDMNKIVIAAGESGNDVRYPGDVAWVQMTVNGQTQIYGGTPWQSVLAEMQEGGQ